MLPEDIYEQVQDVYLLSVRHGGVHVGTPLWCLWSLTPCPPEKDPEKPLNTPPPNPYVVMNMSKEYPPTLAELEAQFWAGNKKASQIWSQIGPDLTEKGFTWPLFLKLLPMKRDLIVLLESGALSITLFIGEIELAARGQIGTFILERGC